MQIKISLNFSSGSFQFLLIEKNVEVTMFVFFVLFLITKSKGRLRIQGLRNIREVIQCLLGES